MPTGKIKWYDVDKGFGFITTDEGGDVYLHASAMPAGAVAKPGARVEFGVADGRRGMQALQVRLLEPVPSVVRGQRRAADDMSVIVEDLIKMLDRVGNGLRRGRYPDKADAGRVSAVLRAVADDLDA